ncbi:MAG: Mrp/NBP35 family ATP-binding protein [Candidatus Calditenuis sp.]|jgi:ATP-binding protein involved in chromosome partitioning|nr:Mrp/NBP35 family ATP-binding protein [Candidatus Calditenuis sp.]
MGPSEKEVLDALRKVRDPELGADVVSMGMIKDLRVEGGRVYFTLELTTPACPFNEQLKEEVLRAARSVRGVTDVSMEVRSRVPTTRPQSPNMVPIPGVKNVVAVASGKGGVGKSTIAVNLAAALSLMGAKTGLLDADVYGPTIPRFIRDYRVPLMRGKDKKVEPAVGPNGLKLISLGMMVEDDTPIIWRGPLVGSAVRQLLFDVDWGELDYLIVDLPPGTGDAPLTLAQSVPMSGVVIVTTPQQAAVAIAMKALRMFQKLGVPIIGIVENMSYLKCEHCSNVIRVFGESWARRAALEAGVPLLGEVPMDREILEGSESGVPIVLSNPDSDASKALIDVARRVAGRVSVLAVGR